MREKKEINIQIGEQVRIAREQGKLTQEVLPAIRFFLEHNQKIEGKFSRTPVIP